MTTIQVRVDERTKRASKKILSDLGLDVSSAINVYLKKIIATNGIPFPLITRNGMTPVQEREIVRTSQEAARGQKVSRAMDVKEAIAHLDALKRK